MRCENKFCIYQKDNICSLDKIEIDSMGMCTECIHTTINESILSKIKTKTLSAYHNEDKI